VPPQLPYPQGQQPLFQPINPQALEYLRKLLGADSVLSIPAKLAGRVSVRDLAHYAFGEHHLIPPARRELVRAIFDLYRPPAIVPMVPQLTPEPLLLTLPSPQEVGVEQEKEEEETGWWNGFWRTLYAATTTLAYTPIALGKALTFGLASTGMNLLGMTPEEIKDALQSLNPHHPYDAPYYSALEFALRIHEAGGFTDNITSFYRDRLKSSIWEDLLRAGSIIGASIPTLITGAVSTASAGVATTARMLGFLSMGENPFTKDNYAYAMEPLLRTLDAHTRLFTKEGKFWDVGTQLLRYQNVYFPLNAPLATDNLRVLIKTKRGEVYEREIPIQDLEGELPRLRSIFPEVQIVSDDPIKSPLAFNLFGKTINPTYAFGLAVELFMPFPTRGIAGATRVAMGLSRFSDEFAFFARRAFAPLRAGVKLQQRAEALAELLFLPSYTAGALPFGFVSRMLGKAGVRLPKVNIGTAGRFAGLFHMLNKANEFFFAQHFIPYELSSGYNATMHRLWDKVMMEARRAGIDVLKRDEVNADLAHFLNAPLEDVLQKMANDEYHPLLRHIFEKEGITAERVAEDLFGARRAIFSKYGDEMSLFAHNLHSSQMRLSIGRGLARANLAVGDAVQRMSTKGIMKWLYPAWNFQDTIHHLTSFGTTLATAMQGRLQVMERTGAELIRGLTGDPAFEKSALFQAHQELSELRNLIRAQYGDPNSPLTQQLASLQITDIDEALKAGEKFLTRTGILPETPIFARLFARGDDDLPLLYHIVEGWRRENEQLLQSAGRTLTPEQAWRAVPKNIRDEIQLLQSEAEAIYKWFQGATPEEQDLAIGILGRGADLTDTLGQYFLKVKSLRGLGFTPQALDELVEHYWRVARRIGLTDEQRLKFQGLLYRLLQNKIFTPDELGEARRFLQEIGIPAEQIDNMLIAYQAGRSFIDANDLSFDFTYFEVRRFLSKMKDAREKWEEAFLKTVEEHFPDCLPSQP
jgi:hypothetical protein